MQTKCQYKATGEPSTEDGNHYKCEQCGHERYSLCEAGRLHQKCTKAPTRSKRASKYVLAVLKWRKAGKPVRTDAEVLRILETICKPCEHFNPKGKCNLCGCRLNIKQSGYVNKIRMATEGCPADPPLWLPVVDVIDSDT